MQLDPHVLHCLLRRNWRADTGGGGGDGGGGCCKKREHSIMLSAGRWGGGWKVGGWLGRGWLGKMGRLDRPPQGRRSSLGET